MVALCILVPGLSAPAWICSSSVADQCRSDVDDELYKGLSKSAAGRAGFQANLVTKCQHLSKRTPEQADVYCEARQGKVEGVIERHMKDDEGAKTGYMQVSASRRPPSEKVPGCHFGMCC